MGQSHAYPGRGSAGWCARLWIGLAALFTIALGRAIVKAESGTVDVYTVADVLGFLIIGLIMSIPALGALVIARRLDSTTHG